MYANADFTNCLITSNNSYVKQNSRSNKNGVCKNKEIKNAYPFSNNVFDCKSCETTNEELKSKTEPMCYPNFDTKNEMKYQQDVKRGYRHGNRCSSSSDSNVNTFSNVSTYEHIRPKHQRIKIYQNNIHFKQQEFGVPCGNIKNIEKLYDFKKDYDTEHGFF
jgi:hypothetical protein